MSTLSSPLAHLAWDQPPWAQVLLLTGLPSGQDLGDQLWPGPWASVGQLGGVVEGPWQAEPSASLPAWGWTRWGGVQAAGVSGPQHCLCHLFLVQMEGEKEEEERGAPSAVH